MDGSNLDKLLKVSSVLTCISTNINGCLHGGGGPQVREATCLREVTRLFI